MRLCRCFPSKDRGRCISRRSFWCFHRGNWQVGRQLPRGVGAAVAGRVYDQPHGDRVAVDGADVEIVGRPEGSPRGIRRAGIAGHATRRQLEQRVDGVVGRRIVADLAARGEARPRLHREVVFAMAVKVNLRSKRLGAIAARGEAPTGAAQNAWAASLGGRKRPTTDRREQCPGGTACPSRDGRSRDDGPRGSESPFAVWRHGRRFRLGRASSQEEARRMPEGRGRGLAVTLRISLRNKRSFFEESVTGGAGRSSWKSRVVEPAAMGRGTVHESWVLRGTGPWP